MRSVGRSFFPIGILALNCAAFAQFPDWIQQAKLTPTSSDVFGFGNASVSGNLAVIGAQDTTVNGNLGQGAAFIFSKNGDAWTQQAELTASDGVARDHFGASIAISGNVAAIGAPIKTVNGHSVQGAVYIFVQSGDTWTQQAELTSSDGQANDEFGGAISLSGNTLMVGAAPHANSIGAVYVFVQSGEIWTLQAELTGSFPGNGLGAAVSLSADTALIGAGKAGATAQNGAAYVFVRNGATWTQQAELTAPDAYGNRDLFGTSVSLSGNLALIGAPNHEKAYVFAQSGSTWNMQQDFVKAGAIPGSNFFGNQVALSGTAAMVGDDGATVNGHENQGSVDVFQQRYGYSWNQVSELEPPDGAAFDGFGGSIWLGGNTAFVSGGGHNAGAAYTFENLASPIGNGSLEQGNTTSTVSFTGLHAGGPSAATRWSIWNNNAGTTTTELCSTTCPSGSTPPTPNQGAYTLHVKATSAYSGIYQVFPPTALVGGSLWLHIVSGSVYVNLFGNGVVSAPAGNVAAIAASSGTLTLPVNGQNFNQLVIYSNGAPAEFYVDAVTLVPPPVTNSSFEQGLSNEVSLTGTGNLGASAATGWNVANGVAGTTTTELCSHTCPSGSVPPAPRAGSHMLHVTTTSASSGVYQSFSQAALLASGALWLNIVSGPVTVTLQGPSGPVSKTATNTGAVFLPANGGFFTGIDINSSSGGPSEFYVDAVGLMPTLATIANSSFETGSSTPVSFTGTDFGGPAAALGWYLWNNDPGTTTTELCTTTCPSGSTPPAAVAGSYSLHVTTTSAYSGVYQAFPLTALASGSMSLHVVSGTVTAQLLNGNNGTGKLLTSSSYPGVFLPANGASYREIILFSWGAPAEFYVDAISLTP